MTRNETLALAIYTWQVEVSAPNAARAEAATARALLGMEFRLRGDYAVDLAWRARQRYEREAREVGRSLPEPTRTPVEVEEDEEYAG